MNSGWLRVARSGPSLAARPHFIHRQPLLELLHAVLIERHRLERHLHHLPHLQPLPAVFLHGQLVRVQEPQ